MKSHPSQEKIPEDRVAAILTRAAELDRPAGVDFDAVRTAAIEAGISQAAVDQALDEYRTGVRVAVPAPVAVEAPQGGRWRRRLRMLAGVLKLGLLGWVLGLVGALGEGAIVLGWLALVGVAVWLVAEQRPLRRAGTFQVAIGMMTVGMMVAYAAVEGDEDVLSVLAVTGGGLLLLGTAAIRLGHRPERSANGVHGVAG